MVTATTIKKGYKQTELGVIPEDWEVKLIEEISNPVRGGSPRPAGSPRYFNGDYIPWLTVASLTNISPSQIFVCETESYLTKEGSRHSRTLEKETVIIANSGATLGVAKLLSIKCCANDGIAALLDVNNNIEKRFVVHYINSLTKRLREVVATGNGQPNLNTELIGNIQIPLPPTKPEQTAIATALSDTDALIERLEKLIAKKIAIKQSTMQQLLTGKKRLPGFSGVWKVKELGEIAEFYKGKGLPKSEITKNGKYKCIHYGELFTTYHEEVKEIFSYTNKKDNFFLSHANDVLMPTSDVTPNGLATASCVKEKEVILGGDVLVIRSFEGVLDGVFLSYGIRQNKKQIMQLVSGSTVYHLYGSDMKKYEFSIPPTIEEQTAIATILSDMDAEIERLEQKRDKYTMLKQGMMQQLLTGRIRIHGTN